MKRYASFVAGALLLLCAAGSRADDYSDSIQLFKDAGDSKGFFDNCYGYAIFPGIGKGGFIVGGAHGNGRVYKKGAWVGDVSMTQVNIGFQIGGEAFREIIFFQDQRAYDEFTNGSFEFGADATAVAITAGAGASAGTTGASANASGGQRDAKTSGKYYRGMATFVILKGGAMAGVSVGGQKFNYKPKSS
ncbi:MAG: lipid-binding SYLF domain-containing protein [Gammaproteobacteria bacterium]|nr:lipid-binding SYLF domain-containing protein [Gammaproteobacteria bacterium]MBV8307443.1 lipid-binding SYLF domain-containing protein [Gammaproteobacteria bacterium]MBV8404835.1 lipid-binding SYLF domain-containing protein [Gammaproteobacteria bacterium]